MDAFGAILCHRHSLTEGIYLVSLAIHVVSWTRFAGCMSRPLFLDMVLSSRRLPSLLRVPASLVPRSRRYYEGATTSHLRISGRLTQRIGRRETLPSEVGRPHEIDNARARDLPKRRTVGRVP